LSIIAISVAGLFSAHGAFAQDTEKKNPNGERLKEVEVVGTSPLPGIGIEEDKLPYDVQSINAETLYRSQSLNLTDFMSRNLSGVNINEVQGSPFQADITYRGFRLSGILGSPQGLSVYLDGVRVNEPFGDVINWDMIPEAAINNVTLVPGSNPIYGLNTLGGALAFTTKSGLTAPGTEVKLQAGSFGRMRADVAYGSKSDDGYHSFISTTGFREDGWRDYSSGQLGNVFAKVGRQQDDSKWDLSLLVGRSRLIGNGLLPSRNYGKDGDDAANYGPGMYENNRRWVYTHPDRSENELNQLTFNLQRILDSDTELAAMAYVRHSVRKGYGGDVEREATVDNTQTPPVTTFANEGALNLNNSRQTSTGGSLNLTKLWEKHQITAGVSTDLSQMRYGAQSAECEIDATRGVHDCDEALGTAGVRGRSAAFGIYASDTYAYTDKTYITGSARFNHARISNTITNYDNNGVGSDRARENANYSSFNPSIGLSHKLAPALTLFGSLGQSNRVPTIIELGCADPANPCSLPTGLQADPPLKQVIAQTIELGTRWRLEDSEVTATIYRAENRDDILFQPSGVVQGRGYFTNFARTRRQGLDLTARTTYGPFSLMTSYSYLDATYRTSGDLFAGDEDVISVKPGMRIAGLPKHTLRFGADWRAQPQLTIGGNVLATSSLVTQGNEDGGISEDGSGDASVKGYFLLNLHANYEASKGLDYFARINNVFDRRYETYGMIAASGFDQYGSSLGSNVENNISRFVAPGAPRNFMVGLRYRF
jgi:outer membrane receptor protein involved in Fe transport